METKAFINNISKKIYNGNNIDRDEAVKMVSLVEKRDRKSVV